MRHRLLESAAIAIALAAAAVPLARATGSDVGDKSDYPQLFAHESDMDDGYKSGYPQLHAIHTYKATTSPAASSDHVDTPDNSQFHAIRTFGGQAPQVQTADRAFHWSDAAIGAGTAAGTIFLAAAAALVLSRRHSRIAV